MANYLCTIRGTIVPNTLSEIFSHSLAISSPSPPNVVADLVRDQWQAQWVAEVPPLSADFPPGITYKEVTCAEILNLFDGTLSAAYHSLFSPERPGTGTGEMLPSQTAVAVSLNAGLRANGTPMRGRFYLPAPTEAATDSAGMLQSVFQQRVADYMGQFISGIQASQHVPAVWSRTEGRLASIDSIRVGNKFDTIRRRRNSLPETYEVRLDLVP